MDKKNKPNGLLDWLHVKDAPNWGVARPLGTLTGSILVVAVPVLFFFALCAAFFVVYHTISAVVLSKPEGINLGAGALIVALLGAPFLIWSTVIKHRTLTLSETALVNDKVNAALEGLFSRRQITRVTKVGDKEETLTEWEDDVVQRNGAIDRLEGLARERPTEAPRIANMLSVYVRELSKTKGWEPKNHPRQDWKELVDPTSKEPRMDRFAALVKLGLQPDQVDVAPFRDWVGSLKPIRNDVEKAAQTLGRLKDIPGVDSDNIVIDLRGVNLQGFDLSGSNFVKANLSGARLEGANLNGARMANANLSAARMEGAILLGGQMEMANLWAAQMEIADLTMACLTRATLTFVRMEGADLSFAQMERATLFLPRLEGANMQGTAAQFVDFTYARMSADQVKLIFGDGSTKLPDTIPRPAHWPMVELDPQTFNNELAKYRANPVTYSPPDVC